MELRRDEWRMPPEWGPHKRTWMMWPCRHEVWRDIEATRRAYAALAHAIRDFEPVSMVARPEDSAAARDLLGADVEVLEFPINDSWSRDASPCFLLDGRGGLAAVDYRFNAWGGKYSPYDGDDAVAAFIAAEAGATRIASDLVAEGGGVSVDGAGAVLTTESCFPHPNRNPGWTRDAIAGELKRTLGAEHVIWLPGDPDEVETDGHVDGIAVFAAPGVVMAESPPPGAPGRATAEANLAALNAATDASGRRLRVVELPEAAEAPGWGDRFCRSYVNSYIVNGGVIAPAYGVGSDDEAREKLRDLFPNRRIAMVPIEDIAVGGGGIHCVTQQEPVRVVATR